MTPADDDKTAFTPREGAGPEPTNFAPTAAVQRTEVFAPPPARLPEIGNVLPVGTRIGEFEITSLLGRPAARPTCRAANRLSRRNLPPPTAPATPAA